MKRVFLVLAIVGAIVPYIFFIQYFSVEGINLGGFLTALFRNGAVGGFTADLLMTSFVFWLWMFWQRRNAGGPRPGPVHCDKFANWTILCTAGIYLCPFGIAINYPA